MMVWGLTLRESTIRCRIWPSENRAPTEVRSGARLPWNRSSGNGPLWHSRHNPTCRLATIARPRAGSPFAPVSEAGIESPAKAFPTRNENASAKTSHQLYSMILQRHRTDALAGRAVERVQHRGRRDADRRLADAAPDRAAGRHEDGLDLRHLRDAHRVVLVEVLLLDASVLDRALLEEERRQAVDERTRHLALDLRRVDRVARVGRGDDAVHLHLVAVSDRDLAGRGDEAVEGLHLRQPAVDAARRGLRPADALGHGVQHGQVPRVVRHQLASEFDGILAGRLRQLVHEAFHEDRVLVDVDAAPEAGRHVRVAHRVVDQQVRHGVAERVLAGLGYPLERERVAPLLRLHDLGANRGEDRLARQAHMQPAQVAARVQAAHELALHDRVIAAVRHVLLARPDHLHRRAGHLLGDEDGLRHVIVRIAAAPAETAAQHNVVDVDLVRGQTRGRLEGRERRFTVLRRTPYLAPVRRVPSGGVHRLHAGVVLERIGVDRLDPLRRAGQRALGVAVLVADEGLLRVQSSLEHLRDGRAGHLGVLALVPDDRQRIERGLRAPPGVRHHGYRRVADLHHLLHAAHALDLGGIEALHLTAEHRAILDRGVQHPRQLEVRAVDHFSVHLHRGVEPLYRLAGDLPGLRILQRHVLRLLEPGGGFRHLAVGRLASRGLVGDDAIRRRALGGGYAPLVGGGLHQHHARRRAALAHVLVRLSDAAAAAGRIFTPDTLGRDALTGGRILDDYALPVALEFLGNQLSKAGDRALAHLGAHDPDDGGVIRPDHDPDSDFRRTVRGADDFGAEWRKAQAQREAAAHGGGTNDERTAADFRIECHGRPLGLGRGVDRRAHLLERPAAADVSHRRIDIGVGGLGLRLQQRRGPHDHAGLAVAALRHLMVDPGLLHLVQDIARGKTFDGGNARAVRLRYRYPARAHRLAVEVHRTGAASCDATAVFGAGQPDLLPDHPQQRCIRVDVDLVGLAVDIELNHVVSSRVNSWRNRTVFRAPVVVKSCPALPTALRHELT